MPKYLKQAITFGVIGGAALLVTLAAKWSLTLFVLGVFSLGVATVFLLEAQVTFFAPATLSCTLLSW